MIPTLEEVQQQAFDAQQKMLLAKLKYEFAKARPELNCDANWSLLVEAHQGKPVTLDSLMTLIQHPEVKSKLAVKSSQRVFDDEQKQRQKEQLAQEQAKQKQQALEDKERDKLIPQILSLLKTSDMVKENERQKYLLRDAKNNWIVPIEQIRTRLKNLQDVQVWRGATTEQLREVLQSKQPKTTGYPVLPSNVTKYQLRMMDATGLRNLIQKYGTGQIDAVLAKEN